VLQQNRQAYQRLQPRANPRLLSIVIPAFNEEHALPFLRQRLTAFFRDLPCAVELVLVDDGSSDRTLDFLLAWAAEDPRLEVVGLARNFGHQPAVSAGLETATGDAVVVMDADLQDPPELILEMLDGYRRGYDVVYGQRRCRQGETRFKRLTAWLFYRLFRRLIDPRLPVDAGDFRLLSRRCVDALNRMPEVHRFLRGMAAWVGFPQIGVSFDRAARVAGKTKYPLVQMLRFSWTAAVSFSILPLRLITGFGLLTALFGVLMGGYAIGAYLLRDWFPIYLEPGWMSLFCLGCLLGGAILVSLGIIGEYVGRIYEQIKGRPLYIVATRAGPGTAADLPSDAPFPGQYRRTA